MKKLLFLSVMASIWAACGGSNPASNATQTVEGVSVEVITTKDTVSGQQLEFQQDPKTKALHGYHKIFHPNGKVFIECQYRNGVKNGAEITYYPSGKIQVEAALKNGMYEGISKEYFENGKLSTECTYIADHREGEMKTYYENGNLKETVTFKNSEENGAFKEFYENGKVQAEGNYMSGKEYGLLLEYNENGELLTKKKCREGQCCTFWAEGKEQQPKHELCAEIIKTTPDK